MPLFPQTALNPGVRKREVFGWAMYDFANSGYTTVVLTAVFNAYFVGVVAGGADWGTLAWTLIVATSSLVVMLTLPAVGAYADLRAAKKRVLAVATLACVLGTAALAAVGRGDLWLAAAAVGVSSIAYAYGEALVAAFLPELARDEALGRVSGWGWSFGYLGGMLALGVSLGWVLHAQSRGQSAESFVPVTMLITAAIYAVACVATFALLRERAVPQPAAGGDGFAAPSTTGGSFAAPSTTGGSFAAPSTTGGSFAASWRRLATTLRQATAYRDLSWFLACGACYQAGIAVVITLAAVYAEQAMGFKQADTMMLVFLVNIAAAAGAFGFGYWQDRIGHKRALAITLLGWIAMTAMAALAQGPALFWAAAVVAGLCMGSSQSAGRALVALFAPAERRAEFFGLWTFAVRLAAIIGPLTYGLITWLSGGNHRIAILSTASFFVAGLLLLARVDIARGQQRARP